MDGVKVDIVSKNIIRPSSPTPESQRTLKLSLIDQLTPQMYGAAIFFYNSNSIIKTSDMSKSLQDSLSKVLTRFYPMAGQVRDSTTIECNDEGAYFLEAKVNCKMGEILEKPDWVFLKQLVPTDPKTVESCSYPVAIFQFTVFACGGVAISMCISHKLGDINMLHALLRAWTAEAASGNEEEEVVPVFVGGSLLPHRDELMIPELGVFMEPSVMRRFIFEGDKIATLKEKIIADGCQQAPTRVEATLAVILKYAVEASREVSESTTPAIFFQTVNIRNMMNPPLPKYSIGNLLWQYPVFIEETNIKLHKIVAVMRKEMEELCNGNASKLKGEEGFMEVMGSLGKWAIHFMTNKDIFRCSSWCRVPLYEVDFGWGKPTWISPATPEMRNVIVLVDTKDGNGVEAWVSLDEKEMAIFEKNKELLEFASLDSNVCV